MSDNEDQEALFVSMWIAGRSVACTVGATMALHLYDYSLDLNREVALFWRFPISAAAGLYFFNRYSCLARSTYYVYGMFVSPASLKSCVDQWFLNTTMDLAPLLPVAGFACLRTYALTQRLVLSAMVLVMSLAPFIVNWIGHAWHTTFAYDPRLGGCVYNIPDSPTFGRTFATASRLPLILSDLIVVVVTWHRTYRLGKSSSRLVMRSLASVMFRNGNIYAITLLLLNSFHWTLTMLLLFGADDDNGHSSFLSRLVDPISGVLVSHFLLDLQEVAAGNAHQQSEDSPSSIRFGRSIGPLGSTLPGPLEARTAEGRNDYEMSWDGHSGDDTLDG